MKGRILRFAAALACVLCASSQLEAQSTRLFLGGGVGIPLGSYDDLVKAGPQITAGVSFQPRNPLLAIQLDANYARFADETPLDVAIQLIYGTVSARYRFSSAPGARFQPYLIGGLGVYDRKTTGDDVFSDNSSTDLGSNLGAGFDIKAGPTTVFFDARWHNVFLAGDNLKMLPLTLGIRFGG